MPFLKTDRGNFFYEDYGSEGPVVYLLHGLTAKHRDWEAIPDLLAKAGYHVFTFDSRGHGQSDKPAEGYSPADYAKDIASWAKALDHPWVHVVGHSTGGRNALAFAVQFPEVAVTLTIIDQTLMAAPENWKKHQDYYSSYPVPFKDEAALDKYLKKKFPDRERLVRFEKGQFRQGEDRKWNWTFSLPAVVETEKLGRAQDAFDLLPKVQCPGLFIKGGDSNYVSTEECAKIKALLPKGRLEVVPNAKHAVFRDNPEGFLAVLIPFLRSVSA